MTNNDETQECRYRLKGVVKHGVNGWYEWPDVCEEYLKWIDGPCGKSASVEERCGAVGDHTQFRVVAADSLREAHPELNALYEEVEITAQETDDQITEDEIQSSTKVLLVQAKAVRITNEDQYEEAQILQLQAKDIIKEVNGKFDERVDIAYRSYKSIYNLRAELRDEAKKVTIILAPVIRKYKDELKRLAEIKRQEEETRIRAEQAKKLAEMQKKKDAEFALLEAAGKGDEALQVMEDAVTAEHELGIQTAKAVGINNVQSEVRPTIKGLRDVDTYKGTVIDESILPREYFMIDQKKINAVVRAAKGKIDIAGVRVDIESGTK